MAKAISDNIAKQRSNVNSQFQTIEYPGTEAGSIENSPALLFASDPQPEIIIRPIPGIMAPIAHIPMPVLRSKPTVRQPERSFVSDVNDHNQIIPDKNDINSDDISSIEADEQAKNAHYSFDSSVQDTINGHSHTRQETRYIKNNYLFSMCELFVFPYFFCSDGLSLKGMYSYSDGFFRRTVHYSADEGGYRVTK